MKSRIALLCALFSAALFAAPAAPKPEWKIRPWEIMQGLKPRGVQLWRLDKDGIDGWTVKGCDASLDTTDLTKLWGEKVARVTFTKPGQTIAILPKTPIAIPEGDGLELWMFGPICRGEGTKPTVSYLVSDASGRKKRVFATGCGSRWARNRWWGTAACILPKELKRPLKLHDITLHKLTILDGRKDDFLCFDQLNAFRLKPIVPVDTARMDLGFPTTPDTILPTSNAPGARNAIRQDGKAWILAYEGKDAKITYRYVPKDGTLGDLTATFNGKPFQPAKLGGVHAKADGVEFHPGDAAINPILHSCRLVDGKVVADWNWTKGGQSIDFTYTFAVKGKSLVVEADVQQPVAIAFDTGAFSGVQKPQLFALTYLHNRWDYPRLLATPDFLASVFCDWYTTHAATCVEGAAGGPLKGAAVLGPDSARLMGGTLYFPKTDGTLNLLHERCIYTVSTELDDILPNIPNPRAKYRDEMPTHVCHTRMYALQGQPAHADQELAHWTLMKQYGLENLFIRFHEGQLRTPLENNRTTLSTDAAMSNGGDPTLKKLITGMRQIYPRIGVYQDLRIIHPYDPRFDYSNISIARDGRFLEGWDGCYRPKASTMLAIYRDFVPRLRAKFPYNAEYLDELTNAPPWADVDYDAQMPGAGTYSRVLRDFGAVALLSRELFEGPIWSEGCAAFFWAGLLDTDYAVSNDFKAGLPLIVDFKLRKILPIETYNGADWPICAGWEVDRLIATEIAEGNLGHLLFGNYCQGLATRMDKSKRDLFLKSYYMMRQIQEQFCASPVAEIKYFVDGEMMTASEMLRAGKTSQNRIYARYENGLETWVNRADEGDWTIEVDGEEFVLPPSGHYARRPDHLLQYSILADDRRVDYSQGPLYTYVNGGGVPYEFPELTAAGPYLLRKRGDATLLTPAPFKKAELVKNLSVRQATPCAPDEKPIAPAGLLSAIDSGADLNIDGKAFHYLLK